MKLEVAATSGSDQVDESAGARHGRDSATLGRQRQLLIDMSVIAQHDAGTGIQRVVRAIFSELRALPLPGVVLRPVGAGRDLAYRYLPAGFPETREAFDLAECEPVRMGEGDVFVGLDLAASIMPRHEAQIASWREAGGKVHVFVYDLLPLLRPQWFRRPTRRHFRRWLGLIERQVDQVICNATDVAQSFRRWNGRWRPFRRRRVPAVTVPLSGEIAASVPSRGVPADADRIIAWMEQRATILMVGTVEPRKGYDQALAAFEWLWRVEAENAPGLLVVGRPGWKTRPLQAKMRRRSSLEGPFLWLDDVSDEFLETLYAHARGLLFASRGEGYGLPLVEAQAFGLPTLVRDLPVLEPNMTAATTRFSTERADDLSKAIVAWLEDEKVVRRSSDIQQLRTWRDVALDLMVAIDVAVGDADTKLSDDDI